MADDRQSSTVGQRVLRVGCSQVGAHPDRYFRRFSALELQQTFFNPPRPATLQRLRRQAPTGFGFVVKAWQLITHDAGSPGYRRLGGRPLWAAAEEFGQFRPTPAVREALRITLESAEALEAEVLFFETPTAFAPSAQSRSRIAAFFEQLDRGGRTLVWDPRGLWSPAEASRICTDLGLLLCSDPLQSQEHVALAEAATVYFRVAGLGRQQALSEDDLLELQAKLDGVTGHCIFDTVEMQRDAERLLALLGVE